MMRGPTAIDHPAVLRNGTRDRSGRGRNGAPYTSAVRRWVCILVLLFGFTGQDYAFAAQRRAPTLTAQPLDRMPWRGPETQPASWWLVQ